MLEDEYYFAEGAAPGVPQVSTTAAGRRDMFNDKRDFSGMKDWTGNKNSVFKTLGARIEYRWAKFLRKRIL